MQVWEQVHVHVNMLACRLTRLFWAEGAMSKFSPTLNCPVQLRRATLGGDFPNIMPKHAKTNAYT